MQNFEFDVNGHKLTVSNAVDKLDDWKVKKAQINSYEKQEVIVKAFEEEFNHIKLLGDDYLSKFEFLTKVCSRNSRLLEWFAHQKLIYSELAQLPNYLNDVIDPNEYQDIKEKVFSVNKTIAKFSNQRIQAAEDYKKHLADIDKNLDKELDAIKSNNKILKVLTLTSQSLPLTMAIALEEFNSKTDSSDFEEKKKLYVRELLTEFKISLLKLIKEKPEIDIDKLIADISLK